MNEYNDIEILEKITILAGSTKNENIENIGIERINKALQNLIKENKELKEKNKKQSVVLIEYQDLLEDSIPKSKVKERYEKLKHYDYIEIKELLKLLEGER